MRSHEFLFTILVAAPLLLSGAASEAQDLRSVIEQKGHDCTDMPKWKCVSLDVPIDHHAAGGGTTKIEYAIHLAEQGDSKGVLFYVVGGPGESGIAEADPWLQFYDEHDDRLR